jgi:hypothetical protein
MTPPASFHYTDPSKQNLEVDAGHFAECIRQTDSQPIKVDI